MYALTVALRIEGPRMFFVSSMSTEPKVLLFVLVVVLLCFLRDTSVGPRMRALKTVDLNQSTVLAEIMYMLKQSLESQSRS